MLPFLTAPVYIAQSQLLSACELFKFQHVDLARKIKTSNLELHKTVVVCFDLVLHLIVLPFLTVPVYIAQSQLLGAYELFKFQAGLCIFHMRSCNQLSNKSQIDPAVKLHQLNG